MGMFWNYRSFPRERWDAVFGGGLKDAENHVIASCMWDKLDGSEPDFEEDHDGWLDALMSQTPPRIADLAKSLCRHGFSYKGRSREEAEILDEMMVGFFCPEGIEELLQAKHCGGDGIKPFILEELLARGKPCKQGGFFGIGGKAVPGVQLDLARFVVGGRRIDATEPPQATAQYVIFWEDEVPRARAEVQLLFDRDVPWSHPEFAEEVTSNLLAALSEAESSNSCLFGRYC